MSTTSLFLKNLIILRKKWFEASIFHCFFFAISKELVSKAQFVVKINTLSSLPKLLFITKILENENKFPKIFHLKTF